MLIFERRVGVYDIFPSGHTKNCRYFLGGFVNLNNLLHTLTLSSKNCVLLYPAGAVAASNWSKAVPAVKVVLHTDTRYGVVVQVTVCG